MAVSADTLRLGIIEETTPGTTPSTPAFDLIRTTGEGLTFEPIKVQSAEIVNDSRGTADSILAGANVAGDVNFELSSSAAMELMLSAALGSDWGDDPGLTPAVGADEAVDMSAIRTFTLEKRFTKDSTPTYRYHRFTGCLVDGVSLSITPNQPITGSASFIGRSLGLATSEIASSTYTSAGTKPIMTAPLVTGIYLATYGSESAVSWMTGACFTSLQLNMTNNIRAIACIGSLGTVEHALGGFTPTLSGTLLWADDDMLAALIADTAFAFVLNMTDSLGNGFQYVFPKVKLTADPVNATGRDTDLVNTFSLEALKDGDPSYTAQLTRTTV